jgi:hypothetical protein
MGANGPADSQPITRRSSLEGRTNLVSDIVRQERLLANHPGASFSLRKHEMPHVLVGGVLVLHGLITSFIGFGAVTSPNAAPMAMPGWMAWWPAPFGRSWAIEAAGLGTGASVVGGLIWLAAGLALILGGFAWLGIGPLAEHRNVLLVGGAALGLVAVALYFHPFYLAAILINVAIIALLWGRLVTAS